MSLRAWWGSHRRVRHEDVSAQCWSADEARAFLVAARQAGPQPGAFYSMALESGMRKAELCGLKWVDIDFEGAKVRVMRQLVTPGSEPEFGPTKNGSPRTIDLSKDLVQLLPTALPQS
jgi:integrase